jgi:hypothetical protein
MPKSPSTNPVESPVVSAATEGVSVVVPNAGTSSVTRSPASWAEVYYPASARGRQHAALWKHAAAMQLHGWAAYEARTGKQVLLTADQYEQAVAAVSGNDFKPHQDADYRTRS